METIQIVGIIALVVLVVAIIFRDRLTEGIFRGNKDGVEAIVRAKSSNIEDNTHPSTDEHKSAGVRISGDLRDAKVENIAGRTIVKGTEAPTDKGEAPGVIIDDIKGKGAIIHDIAGKDYIEVDRLNSDSESEEQI